MSSTCEPGPRPSRSPSSRIFVRARRIHELVLRLDDGMPPGHLRPRRYASYAMRRPPAGCTSTGSNAPSSPTRARQTIRSSSRAPMCGESARTRLTSSCAGASGSSSRSSGPIFSAYVDALLGLRLEPRLVLREDVAQELGRDLGRARVDRAGVVLRRDREGTLRRDRPGVERLDRAVDRDAGLVVPGHERALDRRGAAPARQQRRMDVEPQRALEQLVRDQEAVGADDDRVGGELDGLVEPRRLRHRDPEPLGRLLRRRRRDATPASARACPAASAAGRRRAPRASRSSTSAPNCAVAATAIRRAMLSR